MIYPLVNYDDPILRQEIPKFDFENPPVDPVDLVANLAETMLHEGGIGLAANQCGLPYRVFVLLTDEIIPCFNPLIVDTSQETILLEEGCLSYPGLSVKVRRPRKIKVRYTEPNQNVVTTVFDGITARAFQHELSHLNGIVHLNEASYIHKKQALTQWKKLQRRKKHEA
jgi:peptide deformylase